MNIGIYHMCFSSLLPVTRSCITLCCCTEMHGQQQQFSNNNRGQSPENKIQPTVINNIINNIITHNRSLIAFSVNLLRYLDLWPARRIFIYWSLTKTTVSSSLQVSQKKHFWETSRNWSSDEFWRLIKANAFQIVDYHDQFSQSSNDQHLQLNLCTVPPVKIFN